MSVGYRPNKLFEIEWTQSKYRKNESSVCEAYFVTEHLPTEIAQATE